MPFTEYWSGIEFTGDLIGSGYGKFRLTPQADSFLIEASGELNFGARGADARIMQHIILEEWVGANLQLQRFFYESGTDGSLLRVTGHVDEDSLHVTIINAAGAQRQSLNLRAPVYSSMAPYLYPLLVGVQAGARYQYQIYNTEFQQLEQFEQAVIGYEAINGVPAWRVEATTSLAYHNYTSWIDARGLPVYEKAAFLSVDGGFVSRLISQEEALAYCMDMGSDGCETKVRFGP